ncbi:MAG: hypothetical protein IJ328_01130 [Muribaculaceae bacterium]|nr:hypothetical protein [Muribaculaceae bacterium]
MPKFGDTERYVLGLFSIGKTFSFRGEEYTVIHSGKPRPTKGECKTDVYVLASKNKGERIEFKISVKQSNADFVENKIELPRAKEILGEDAQNIIRNSVEEIKDAFARDYLICFDKYKRTDPGSIKLGWRFEFVNVNNGEKSGLIKLSDIQKVGVYAGTNLSLEKKNCIVGDAVVPNSGIANYILVTEGILTLQECVDKLMPIEDYAKRQNVYFACKALNYQFFRKKCEGNRGLAVYVNWSIKGGNLCAELVYDDPLSHKGFEIRDNLMSILERLNIGNNLDELKKYLDKGVKFYTKKLDVYGEGGI